MFFASGSVIFSFARKMIFWFAVTAALTVGEYSETVGGVVSPSASAAAGRETANASTASHAISFLCVKSFICAPFRSTADFSLPRAVGPE